jgi:Na+-translocating ferredoxin:NAD+ oxidoreductase RnfG subunit
LTDQFNDVRLDGGDELDRQIDGITGATLSVNAVTRVVRLALFLYRHTGVVNG